MINIPISIQLPNLWNTQIFTKNEWSQINLIVGPNGTGKSLFADELKKQLTTQGYKVRLLNAERLSGFEKTNYRDFTGLASVAGFEKGFDMSKFNSLKISGEKFGLSSDAFILLKERLDIRIKIEALLSD